MSVVDDLLKGFRDVALETGRQDYQKAHFLERELKGQEADSPMLDSYMASNPGLMQLQESTGRMNPEMKEARRQTGLGLSDNRATRWGQRLGATASDIMNDSSRSFWWLINAPQATASVIQDLVLQKANPDLYMTEAALNAKKKPIGKIKRDKLGYPVNNANFQDALAYEMEGRLDKGLIDRESGTPRKGVTIGKDGEYRKRIYAPGSVKALSIPTAVGINAGLGLLNPLGGQEGYEAAIPDANDPSKTANPILEVGAKYILGRTGNLLNYDEFKEVRPDVSKGEYNAYKAFKYDKDIDINPFDDGKVTLPAGVLKATMDGIHGPEIQFLGRSMPLLTSILPTAGAILGTAAGVRYNKGKSRTAIRDGLIGGGAGLAGSTAAGLIAEEFRRRAGSVSNEELTEYQS